VGCGADAAGGAGGSGGAGGTGGSGGTVGGSCSTIPEETAGPYPGDGSNGPNALTASGIVRSDIRPSFGNLSGTAAGVPLQVMLQIVQSGSCAPLAGAAVYVWHCDRDGNYSLYTAASQNYLRGVQVAGSDGKVTFQSIFPGCYSGRWPHIHFEVYPDLASAGSSAGKIATSQLALPKASCDLVYGTAGYESSGPSLSRITLSSDMVFSDGATLETPVVTGSVAGGFAASLVVAV
jgi:protocatechuate 3,4-dioxygenase beta subunit